MSIETVLTSYSHPPRKSWCEKVRAWYWRNDDHVNGVVLAACVVLLVAANLI